MKDKVYAMFFETIELIVTENKPYDQKLVDLKAAGSEQELVWLDEFISWFDKEE